MDNFKKWWSDRKMKDYLWGDFGSHEDTWKAALEWALSSRDDYLTDAARRWILERSIEKELHD